MRILHVVQKPQRRGAEIFASDLGVWLRGRGHEVSTVYLYEHHGGAGLTIGASDVQLGGCEKSVLERVPGWHPGVLKGLLTQIRTLKPDIVMANGARTVKYCAIARMLDAGGWKFVYRNIDSPRYWLRGGLRTGIYRCLVMRRVQAVVGVSKTTLSEVVEMYWLKVPVQYIPRGVDFGRLGTAGGRVKARGLVGVDASSVVLLFCGSLAAQKRPDRFLRLLGRLTVAHPEVVGLVLGDGPLRGELVGLAGELGLEGKIRFLGYQGDVTPYYEAADIHVSSSDSEGTPGSVLEASYFSLPTVATDVGGTHECVRDGVTGYLVPPGDEDILQGKTLELIKSAEMRSRMGSAAHAYVTGIFSIDVVGRAYESFYQRLLNPRSEAAGTAA